MNINFKILQVCLALLEEIAAGIEQPRKHYVETRSNLSDGYVSLGSSEFLVLGRSRIFYVVLYVC